MKHQKKTTQCFGQLVFFEGIERSPFRTRLARVALNLSGEAAAYPVDFAEAVHGLPWRECQSALTFASLAASMPISWPSAQRSLLVAWAAHQPE